MIFPTEKKLPESKPETQALMEQVAATLHYEAQQLKRTLWLAAMANGGALLLNEKNLDILWQLSFERSEEGMMKISALRIPEVNPADIEQMAKDLLGTNGPISDYAAAHERLKEYPLPYIEFMLTRLIRFDGESWKETPSPVTPP